MKKAILIIATVLTSFLVMSFQTPATGIGHPLSLSDTTAPVTRRVKAAPDTVFYLGGKINAFQFLMKAIISPDDVTNNDRKKLMDWINTAFPVVDTVGKR